MTNQYLKKILGLAFLMIIPSLLSGCLESNKTDQQTEWKPLFDGKTLNGWHILPGGSWHVEDGAIVGTSPKSEKRHGILVSDKQYDDFTVRFKFKRLNGNSGFYFRVEEVGGTFGVCGFQAEVEKAPDVGGIYETCGRGWVAKSPEDKIHDWYKDKQWNQVTIEAYGRDTTIYLNGHKTVELKDDPGRTKGHFGLQLHGGLEMHVLFKDIEIKTD